MFRLYDKHDFVFVNIHLKARRLDEDENERTKDEALSLSILAEAMKDTVGKGQILTLRFDPHFPFRSTRTNAHRYFR